MLYASVVFNLAIDGPFDYIVPQQLRKKIKPGARVWVMFGTRKKIGFVVALSRKTGVQKLKTILELIDENTFLDKDALLLTRKLCEYYCCSWGEMIDTALPQALRKGRKIPASARATAPPPLGIAKRACASRAEVELFYEPDFNRRWNKYLEEIKKVFQGNKSVIILVTDLTSLTRAKEAVEKALGAEVLISHRKQRQEVSEWQRIREKSSCIVAGTRSAVFAPVNNLGLIIIDEEEDSVYKQDQVPHYHARTASLLRARICRARLILGSSAPSLEAWYAYKCDKLPATAVPEVKIIDIKEFFLIARRNNILFSKYISGLIANNLDSKGKTLVFINRKGFATFASCDHCNAVLRCPRCSAGLVYHFQHNSLACRYCNYSAPAVYTCPECKTGTIRYSGLGAEKIESEIYRLFPQARIRLVDNLHQGNIEDADIFIATEAIIKLTEMKFDLTCVFAVDNALNRVDFRSSEKVFSLLSRLRAMSRKTLIIQTSLPKLHVFCALAGSDSRIFYKEELRQRKNLGFPPYKHLAFVKLRGKNSLKVTESGNKLFETLKERNTAKDIEVISVNAPPMAKLRGNYYRQILLKGRDPRRISKFLKINLKNFRHSGIIVTVDIDPI